MDNYDSDFGWRWRLESIQPGGPTGANIGNLLQDLRTVWHGGQANAVNNELAQNAAYRKELENEGKELTDVWNNIDNRNLELARFADAQQGRAMQKVGHANAAIKNLIDADDEVTLEFAIKQAREAGLSDDQIEQVISDKKQKQADAIEMEENYWELLNNPVFKEKYTGIKDKKTGLSDKDIALQTIENALKSTDKKYDRTMLNKLAASIRQGRTISSEIGESSAKTRGAKKTDTKIKEEEQAKAVSDFASGLKATR